MTKSAEIKTNRWHNETNYLCPFCPHATTLGKDVMQAHIVGGHSAELRESELEKMTASATKATGGVLGGPQNEESK